MSDMDEGAEPVMERYRGSLGSFVHDFTLLELFLFRLLCAAAGVSEEMGQALFSGTRADALVSLIRRCYHARKTELPPFVERALAQSQALNSARNDVVHFATFTVEDDEEAVLATNRFRYPASRARDIRIEPARLEEMARDARIIPAMLAVAAEELSYPNSMPRLSEEMREPMPPWHYQPPSPQPSRRKD